MLNPDTFVCDRKCGLCCIKYIVKLTKKDIINIKKLGYDEDYFVEEDKFLGGKTRFVLKKKDNGWCIFLSKDKKGIYSCEIYNSRPSVCRRYPFLKKKNIKSCKPVTFSNH